MFEPEMVERYEEALHRIVQWADAYPLDAFPEPDFAKAREALDAAGISLDGMAHKLPEASWDTVLDTNLKGSFNMARAVLPLMRDESWGRIINLSSIVGQIGVPGTAAYSASKAGLFGLTRALAAENASKNVTINTLALGYFDAGMIKTIPPEQLAKIVSTIPMKRLGDPRDLVRAVRFLIEADYVTGTTININGGLLGAS